MRTDVKYLFHAIGHMPASETANPIDITVSHTSYSNLRAQLRRDGRALLYICQRGFYVTDNETYSRIDERLTIIALYRDCRISPLLYNGFQG